MKKYCVKIFGCQMNYADAERVAGVLDESGWEQVNEIEEADAVFLLTCSVKQKAEDKVFGMLDNLVKWKAEKAGRKIGLSGCMVRKTSSQESKKKDAMLRRSTVLDFVWRIEDSAKLPELLDSESATNNKADYFQIQPSRKNPAQVSIPIMTGCDNFCTYCIVPHARGREVSRNEEEIVAECEKAVKNGALEITLLGQNVNSYQKDKKAFAQLLEKVAQIPGLQRLRFTSSHPKDFDENLIEIMARNENIEKHLHLPAQHGDDEILEKMNRKYTSAEYLALVKKFREKLPEASITTDFIVGFPDESEEAFENLLNFYRTAKFDFAFFSKYSPRPETAAASFENQIPEAVKKQRFQKLNDLVVKITTQKYAQQKNKILEVLVEKCNCHCERSEAISSQVSICEGRSSESYLVKFEGSEDLVRKLVKVKIIQPREVELWGEKV